MIDQTQRRLAQAIYTADSECIRVRAVRLTPDGQFITQDQIDAADIAWVDANEAYAAAGYDLETLGPPER